MTEYKEDILKFYNGMVTQFDLSKLIFFTYNKKTHELVYKQGTNTLRSNNINYMFLPDNCEYGVLTPIDAKSLMDNLLKLINMKWEEKVIAPTKLGFDVYSARVNTMYLYPMVIVKVKLISITNRLLVRILCRRSFLDSENPLKFYLEERKLRKNANKISKTKNSDSSN